MKTERGIVENPGTLLSIILCLALAGCGTLAREQVKQDIAFCNTQADRATCLSMLQREHESRRAFVADYARAINRPSVTCTTIGNSTTCN